MTTCTEKVLCQECDWHGILADVQTAPNPFDMTEQIMGCPACHSVDSMRTVCDEPECRLPATCGTPTPDGYRQTCSKHIPSKGLGHDPQTH